MRPMSAPEAKSVVPARKASMRRTASRQAACARAGVTTCSRLATTS
ncbi:MAG: hypothetical protein U1F87_11155 [Kiritimatiellia bacterium]